MHRPYWLVEADFTAKQRKALAAKGSAMPDGSFPIRNEDDLGNAVSTHGLAKNKAAAKAHITKRAKALGLTAKLPADWTGSTKKAAKKAEAAKPAVDPNLNEAAAYSMQQINDRISQAARKEFSGSSEYPWDVCSSWDVWVNDTYEDYAVINIAGTLYSIPYAIDADKDGDGDITFGEPTAVIPSYRAASEVTGDGDGDADDGVMAPAGIPEAFRAPVLDLFAGKNTEPLAEAGRELLYASLTVAEAGRTLSKANEDKLRGAIKTMSDHVDTMTGAAPADDDPATEAATATELTGDLVPLLEKAIGKGDRISLKVIQPGWGSSGYYSREVLERDGPLAFPAATKMYADHPTTLEDAQRPERSIRDLWAETITPATFRDGPAGPGLYAEAKVLGPKDAIETLAPHIGVSIRASGKAKTGEAEGRKGKIIETITAGHSIDFVTVPGAGGQVLQLFESARGIPSEPAKPNKKVQEGTVEVDERAYQLLKESNAQMTDELARLKEGQLLTVAKAHVREVLNKRYGDVMAPVTIERLTESLGKRPALTDGSIDYEAFGAIIHEAAKAEIDYVSTITGAGKVRGMGSGSDGAFTPAFDIQESQAQLESAFTSLGMSANNAKVAAIGRAA